MRNLFTIFVSPELTFQRVRESKTAWIYPFIIGIIVSLFVVYLQSPLVEESVRQGVEEGLIDPSMYDAALAGSNVMMWVTGILTSAGVVFIMGLLFMLLNLIVRGEAKYMQLVTLAVYSALPGLVGSLITGVMLMMTDAKSMADVTLSLAVFVTDKSSTLYHLFALINPFSLWTLILYVLGASVMMRRPRKTVGIWIIGTWLVLSLGALLL